MGLELELSSELALLLPIRVTATARPDAGVAPEEAGSATVRRQGGDVGGEKVDDGAGEAEAESSSAVCVTPTSAASALPAATACPPAPRKPRPAKRRMMTKRCCCGGGRPRRSPFFFPVPHDLAAVFVARAPATADTSPACPPPAKKIRVHAVG